ncbi:transposase IS66 [Pseudomonas syringae CC1557]|uniref:Transposase IS66 n=2 Tax=Pseudomonas syringae TaxID=317 RepID=W0N0H8_PSESX|nr:transposase IS66 [Pseudomonas syringae CC1557]
MMRPHAKVEKVYLYPKPVDFRKSIDGLAALVEPYIKVAVFDPVLFVFLNRHGNLVKILYWERNGFCLWLKRLESERFKASPDETDEAIVLVVQELNWLLYGFDLWRNRPYQVLTPRFVALRV